MDLHLFRNGIRRYAHRHVTCAGCHEAKPVILCQSCINRIARSPIVCTQCAKPMESDTTHRLCADCLRVVPWFDATRAIGQYDNFLKRLLLSAKIERSVHAVHALRYLCRTHVDLSGLELHQTCLVAVPSPKTRMAIRGFNLPQLLATTLHREFDVPIVKHAFYTPFYVRKQTRKTRQTRLQKPATFVPTNTLLTQLSNTPHVLLIDDVLTTGKTADNLAKILKENGAQHVTVLVLAR